MSPKYRILRIGPDFDKNGAPVHGNRAKQPHKNIIVQQTGSNDTSFSSGGVMLWRHWERPAR